MGQDFKLVDFDNLKTLKVTQEYWDKIKGFLKTNIQRNQRTYDATINRGVREAATMLRGINDGESTSNVQVWKEVNRMIYGTAHQEAGQIRTKDEKIAEVSHPDDIEQNMADVTERVKELESKPNLSKEEKAEICAYEHAAMMRIDPFQSGSYLTARVMLAARMEQMFKKERSAVEEKVGLKWDDVKDNKKLKEEGLLDNKSEATIKTIDYQIAVDEAIASFPSEAKYDKAINNALEHYSPKMLATLVLAAEKCHEETLKNTLVSIQAFNQKEYEKQNTSSAENYRKKYFEEKKNEDPER